MVKLITILLLFLNHFPYDNKIVQQNYYHKDSTVFVFNDSGYQLTLHVFNEKESFNESINNSTLTFQKIQNGKSIILFRDSLFCLHPEINLQDFNNDGIKDVAVFNSTGARANLTYHLYITNPKNHTLNRVKGFENLVNPDLDTTNNIIVCIGLGGGTYYSFFRINSTYKLINLGHAFEENPKDSTQFDRVIKQILKKHSSEQQITITGKAIDLKAGAAILTSESGFYYVDGLASWNSFYNGKKIKVVGKLVIEETKKQSEKEVIKQEIVGIKKIIIKPVWTLIK